MLILGSILKLVVLKHHFLMLFLKRGNLAQVKYV